MLTIGCGIVVTLALAVVALLIGNAIKNRVGFLQKYCIPSPVVGGFIFMLLIFIGKYFGVVSVTFQTTFQTVFMVAFFTTVGLSADFRLIKAGGGLLLIYWLLAATISALQGPLALFLGGLMDLEPAYSITAGAISMCGGHGAGAAYGGMIKEMGWPAATDCALACATLGLICSVMLGGPLSRRLILKNNLKPPELPKGAKKAAPKTREERRSSAMDIMKNFAVIVICMTAGILLAKWASMGINILVMNLTGSDTSTITLPDYIGAMFVSVLVRNLNEKFHWFNYNAKFCDGLGGITLDVFLSIAMMSINLLQLIELGPRLAVIVLVEVVVMGFYVYFIVFRALGKNFDAAVMCGGMCGHALGATPTAMANMEAVSARFGFSQKAFVIVPIVGAFLVDLVYQPVSIVLINMFVPYVA